MLVAEKGETGKTGPQGEQGPQGETGPQGERGETGNGIAGIQRTAGSGAPGTRDTYTITYTDGSTDTFQVYNGADGTGAGDMRAETYDPTGKAQDVFAYADAAAVAKQDALTGQPGQVVGFNAGGKPAGHGRDQLQWAQRGGCAAGGGLHRPAGGGSAHYGRDHGGGCDSSMGEENYFRR